MKTLEMEVKDMEVNSPSEEYIKSYEALEVHHLMLNDHPRMRAYSHAISSNKSLFHDKVVVDVGAGTGILSVFCAQAGAKKVYAIEASGLAELIKEVAKENKLSDVIEVIQGNVEDVVLPGGVKADILVSEWMGFYLLHEGMLDSVVSARDRLLVPGGPIFPERADLWAAPCSLPAVYDFWEDVHGVKMSCVGRAWRENKGASPIVEKMESENLLGPGSLIATIDLQNVTSKDLDTFSARHVVASYRKGRYQGVCVWFTVRFPSGLTLSTAPSAPPTHWKQTTIVLPSEREVEEKEPLAWELTLSRDKAAHRHYDIQLTLLDPEEEKHPSPCDCYMTKCIVIKAFLAQAEADDDENYEDEVYDDDEEEEEEDDVEDEDEEEIEAKEGQETPDVEMNGGKEESKS